MAMPRKSAAHKAAVKRAYKIKWRAANRDREREKDLQSNRRRRYPAPTRPEPAHCEVCGRRDKRRLHLDHDHELNVFRGWLCTGCNRAIGFARDNPIVLRGLATYLERALLR